MAQTKNKPVIGIVPSFDDGRAIMGGEIDRIYLRRDYLQAIANAGAIPLILHPETDFDDVLPFCDGVVISGGLDIDPGFYGQEADSKLGMTEPTERFTWEKRLIEACDASSISILGVCYGMQRLNVHYGGTLIQDIPSAVTANIGHISTMHTVRFSKQFLGLKARVNYTINSRHHQALQDVADGFKVRSRSSDGIIEAIEGHGHFGVQWHPESDDTSKLIYGEFVKFCRQEETVSLTDFLPEATPA